jgi:myo-inositol-1(or 4)-monophosphatase
MGSLHSDDFWTDTLWQRSAIAARDAVLFDAWKRWIRARQ